MRDTQQVSEGPSVTRKCDAGTFLQITISLSISLCPSVRPSTQPTPLPHLKVTTQPRRCQDSPCLPLRHPHGFPALHTHLEVSALLQQFSPQLPGELAGPASEEQPHSQAAEGLKKQWLCPLSRLGSKDLAAPLPASRLKAMPHRTQQRAGQGEIPLYRVIFAVEFSLACKIFLYLLHI